MNKNKIISISFILVCILLLAIIVIEYIKIENNITLPQELNIYQNNEKVGIAKLNFGGYKYNKEDINSELVSSGSSIFSVLKSKLQNTNVIKLNTTNYYLKISLDNMPKRILELSKTIELSVYDDSEKEIESQNIYITNNDLIIYLGRYERQKTYYVNIKFDIISNISIYKFKFVIE